MKVLNAEQLAQRARIHRAILDASTQIKDAAHRETHSLELMRERHKAITTLSHVLGRIAASDKEYDVATKHFFRSLPKDIVPVLARVLLANNIHMSSMVVEKDLSTLEKAFTEVGLAVPLALRAFYEAHRSPRPVFQAPCEQDTEPASL